MHSPLPWEVEDASAAFSRAEDLYCAAADPTERLLARAQRAAACARLGHPVERFTVQDLLGVDEGAVGGALIEIALASAACGDAATTQRWLDLIETSNPSIRAKQLLLRGWLAEMRCAFREQADLAAEAVRCLMPLAKQEAALFAHAARTYADLAREIAPAEPIDLPAVAEMIARSNESRSAALRAHAWMLVLRSDYEAALKTLIQATMCAQTPLAHIATQLDIAFAAVTCGDAHSPFARAALGVAVPSSLSIDWKSASQSDARLLPQMLQLCAEMQCISNARALQKSAVRVCAAGPRNKAYLQEAQAYQYAHTDKKTALSDARSAYDSFESFQFEWRAGRTALFIYQLSGSREWERRARKHLKGYPKSRYYRLLDAGNAQRLTHRQQQVLDAVLRGKTPVQIALHLGIAEDTVRKHLKPLMRHFGVKTRLELLARHFKDHDATFQRSESSGSAAKP